MLEEKTGKRIVFSTPHGDAVATRSGYRAAWSITFPWRRNEMVLKAKMDQAATFMSHEVKRYQDYKESDGGYVKLSKYYRKLKLNVEALARSHCPEWLGTGHAQVYGRRLSAFLLERGLSVTKVHMRTGVSFKILNSIANQMPSHVGDDKPVHVDDIDHLAIRAGRRRQNDGVTRLIRKENE